MFDTIAIEQTTVFHPSYTQTYFERPSTANPITERRRADIKTTVANSIELRSINSDTAPTATVADIAKGFQSRRAVDNAGVIEGVATNSDKTQQDRVTLLAKKYAGKLDPDASARLEILTQRMRLMRPRVNSAMLNRMENIAIEVNEVTDGIAALRAEFGI